MLHKVERDLSGALANQCALARLIPSLNSERDRNPIRKLVRPAAAGRLTLPTCRRLHAVSACQGRSLST